MSSRYPILDNRPIDQWKVTELKEELKRRKLTTRGLKDDLIKRLDESIRSEIEKSNLASNNGLDSSPQSEQNSTENMDQNNINVRDSTDEKLNEDTGTEVPHEQERSDAKVSDVVQETVQDSDTHLEQVSAEVADETLKSDTNDSGGLGNEGKTEELEIIDGTDSVELEKIQILQVAAEETTEIVSENVESVVLSEQDLQSMSDDLETNPEGVHLEAQLENDDSQPLQADNKLNESYPHNQVSEVNPVLGVEVKSDSISTETVTINEKNELKDNIIADDVKIELDVKPDMVQPSSSDHETDGGKSHPMDVEELHANKVSMEETGGNSADIVDDIKKIDSGDLSSEKLNLDRSSGDDFMEEDVMEGKQIDSKSNFDEVGVKSGKEESPPAKEEGVVDIVGEEDLPAETKVTIVDEKNTPAASSVKRKLNDQQTVLNNDSSKRQRKWNSEGFKISQPQSGEVLPTTPKEANQPAFKRSFSRSDSNVGEEAPKERLVPPSSKPPTNSLRIDRFLRPFTLKALHELLGRTGTVTDFWMDHIKTHCYVSYSSVEEAVETRNGVYNLQWPQNGGRLLVAEFVDPQEVKARVEAPSHSLATPANSAASVNTPLAMQPPQPSPRQQVQKQQLQPPTLLPPPPPQHLSNPPTPRDHPTSVRERLTLPPPPPLPEKVDPPIVTLDDLFRKTRATPRIYYLPLSDEQVAAKLQQAQGKTVKQ